jgi:hypothetical protein
MIDKATAIPIIMNKLKKLPLGHALDLRTYKRNRSVVIARIGEDSFDIVQKGFFEERYLLPLSKMKKLLKTVMKQEFPRSTKIRLYDLGQSEAASDIKRKTI